MRRWCSPGRSSRAATPAPSSSSSGTSGVDLTNLRDYIADKSAFIAIKRFKQPWFDEAKQSRVRGLLLDKIKATL